jgi:hypothetical protein
MFIATRAQYNQIQQTKSLYTLKFHFNLAPINRWIAVMKQAYVLRAGQLLLSYMISFSGVLW